MGTQTTLPKNIAKATSLGVLSPNLDDFSSRVCAAISKHCPQIQNLHKAGGELIATNTCGKVVFTCPLPDTMLSYSQALCQIVYVDTSGQEVVVNLTDVLEKAQDALAFSALDCVLSYNPVAPSEPMQSWDLSVILDKLRTRLKWDDDACALVLCDAQGSQVGSWDLTSILDKHPALTAQLNAACELEIGHGDSSLSVPLAPLLDKLQFAVTFDAAACVIKIDLPGVECYEIPLTSVLQKAQDVLTWNQNGCFFEHTNVNGQSQVINVGADILAKIQTSVDFNPDTCLLSFINAQGALQNQWNIGAAIIAKLRDGASWDGDNCILTLQNTNGDPLVIPLQQILDKLSASLDYDEDACQIKFQFGNQPAQCHNIGQSILDKIVFPDETVTTLTQTNPDPNGNATFTYTNEDGVPVTVTFCARCPSVSAGDNVSVTATIGDNGEVNYVVSAPAETVTSLVDNGDGTFTYTNESGEEETVSFCAKCPTVVAGTDNVTVDTQLGPNGETQFVVEVVETVTTLVDNGNGSFTYTNEDGEKVTVKFCPVCPVVDAGDNTQVTTTFGPNGETIYTVDADNDVLTSIGIDPEDPFSILYIDENGDPESINIKSMVEGCFPIVEAGDNITVDENTNPDTGQVTYTINAAISKEDINPQCVGGCFEVCGVRVGIAKESGSTIWNPANQVQFEAGVSVGDVIESPVCGTFTTPECLADDAEVTLYSTLQFNHRNHTAGLFALRIELSIDNGATWTRAEFNGYVVGPPNLNNTTDYETSGTINIPIDSGTTYTVKSRAFVNIASGTFDGEVPLNQFEVDWDFDYLSCETS